MTKTHRHAGVNESPTYTSWRAMKDRCNNPHHVVYRHYGGRGISVCERWNTSFESFLADMGERPPGTTLDRFPDKDGNYEPGNCRWATSKQQNRNSAHCHLIDVGGKKVSMTEAAEMHGLTRIALRNRLRRGWPIERALSTPSASKGA